MSKARDKRPAHKSKRPRVFRHNDRQTRFGIPWESDAGWLKRWREKRSQWAQEARERAAAAQAREDAS